MVTEDGRLRFEQRNQYASVNLFVSVSDHAWGEGRQAAAIAKATVYQRVCNNAPPKTNGGGEMIVWRGWGLLALLIGAAINVGIEQLTNNFLVIPEGFKHYRDAHTWVWFIGMLLSALACWFAGLALDKRALNSALVVTDKETGHDLHLLKRHDMFWIPVKWWSVIYLGIGVWFWMGR